ncbi:MAG TPA: glyceraldehyde-3-phosphate dehydrogenase [Saprospiraceae bacterium]|nr:glyceraldehyde-3-phosphate dehydrogenase [Saprospiraceae bacterium]
MSKKDTVHKKRINSSLSNWREQEKTALELLKVIGELRFNRAIELVFFRHPIYDTRPSEVVSMHRVSKKYVPEIISMSTSLSIAQALLLLEHVPPAKIDIGVLATKWIDAKSNFENIYEFIKDYFDETKLPSNGVKKEPKDVVLYGFGRIGRLVARRIVYQTGRGSQLRLRAIVVRPKMASKAEELEKRAALLRYDSIHGKFHGVVVVDSQNSELIINGNRVKFIFAKEPKEIDYTKYDIENAMVIDNTGVWRDKKALSAHLRPGVSQVMLTAPAKDIPNIVYGANQKTLNLAKDKIFSAASCTTNAIVPPLQVLDDLFGVEKGHIETIHAYTNDQNLLDNFHKKPRRGRGAPINMVLTTTGAAKAVAKALPQLKDKLTGNAVRVPVPDGSIAILNLTLKKKVTVAQVNGALKEAALTGPLVDQIQYSDDTEFVSTSLIGSTTACTIDAPSTIVSKDGLSVTIYAWYDNEHGYSSQVVRLAKMASKVLRFVPF